MGTPAEERFDRITNLARAVFDVPISIIDIVGEQRAWLKSVSGSVAPGAHKPIEVPRENSYCHYTVLNEEPTVIPDARLDPRTSDNPNAPYFVFYAGVPLRYEGENVGVLCIADTSPRNMKAADIGQLHDLAALAEQEFHVAKLSESQLSLAAENEVLEAKAYVDGLTRLWNRTAIREIGVRELESARVRGESVGVAMLDVDHFKKVNDTHGHGAGDAVLRAVADRLRSVVREHDAVGRWGGEEFLLVLPNCTQTTVMSVCHRVRAEIESMPIAFRGGSLTVTVSVGVTVSNNGAHFLDALTKAADEALYAAKGNGRNRVESRWVTP